MGAISGMPIEETYPGQDGYTMVKFKKSPIMSTYLLAFLVSDFVYTENQEEPDLYKVIECNWGWLDNFWLFHQYIWFQVYHSRTKSGQAELAAAAFPSILHYYEEVFDLDFPLDKLDMAAIPDFSAGAMENWGLVMYREVTS